MHASYYLVINNSNDVQLLCCFITNRDIPIFVTIPMIFLTSKTKKNSVQNGKMDAKIL